MGWTLAKLRQLDSSDFSRMTEAQLREIVKGTSRSMNRALAGARKAGAKWGYDSASLETFEKRYDSVHYNKNLTRNELLSIATASARFLRGEDITEKQLRAKWISQARDLIGGYIDFNAPNGAYYQQDEQIIETYMRQYLKEKGITRVSKRDLAGRFAQAIPKEFVTNFRKIEREFNNNPQFKNLPSEIQRKLMSEYKVEYTDHPDWSFDEWIVWAENRAAELLREKAATFSNTNYGAEF